MIYAADTPDLSPLQAQIDLALSPNRPLRDAVFEIDLAGLRSAGYGFSDPRQVGRAFNMPGGGTEVLIHSANVPKEFIRRVR